jgi:predicted dehydrogenase
MLISSLEEFLKYMAKIRCSLIGLGRIGSSLEDDALREKPCTHAGAITANPECELWGGCDIDEQKRNAYARRWQVQAVFSDVVEMLRQGSPDILIIATPPETHLPIFKQVLVYPIKVIICEKPLAVRIKDALKLVQLAQKHHIKLITNHERRYSLDYLQVREHIQRETWGRLVSITARLFMGKQRSLDDILLYDGTHLIDILQFLTSKKLKRIASHRYENEQAESLVVYAKAGTAKAAIPIVIEAGNGRDYLLFEIDLIFTQGRMRVGNGLYEEYESKSSPYYESMKSLLRNNAQRPLVTGYFANMLQDAVTCFKEPLHEPVSSGWDGYCAQLFIDGLLKH